jgi:hypothetical protein
MSVDTTNIVAGLESVRAHITGAIKQAANATGASFEYLLSAAKIESNLNPTAAAPTSSARGLYQFIEQTWLGTVKEAGPSLGYGKYADAISKSPSGTYSVSDPAARDDILKLRDDPGVNAAMAGVLTQSNSFKLTSQIGRRPTDGELYIAHFMGVSGAAKLISSAEDSPQANAAKLFPGPAASNRSIFYDHNGGARSVSDVYSVLTSRYESAANSPATRDALAVAGVGGRTASTPVDSDPVGDSVNARYLSRFPLVQQVASATPAAQSQIVPGQPVFRSLFQAGDRAEPVAPAIQELWGNGASLTSNAPRRTGADAQPLDLFSDRSGSFSG